ncbi:hypothetical protein JW905_11510 [bacterium]|nr:hypothetical protein [candidate division CSSED10-310 bacterium]
MAFRIEFGGGGFKKNNDTVEGYGVKLSKIYEDWRGGSVLWDDEDEDGEVGITLSNGSGTSLGASTRAFTVPLNASFPYLFEIYGGACSFTASCMKLEYSGGTGTVTLTYFGAHKSYDLSDYTSGTYVVKLDFADAKIPGYQDEEDPPYEISFGL